MNHVRNLNLVLLLAGLTACSGGSGHGSGGSTAAPVVSAAPSFRTLDRGQRSGVVTSPPEAGAQRLVADDAAFAALWADHTAAPGVPGAQPAVDFGREQVAGLFLGQRPSDGWGIEVTGVAEVTSGGQTVLEVSYQRLAPLGPVNPGPTTPFHLVALDRRGPVAFRDVTPAPAPTPLRDVHGELVAVPAHAGGQLLAFLPDGAPEALELEDPSALLAAQLHEGHALVVTGDARSNAGGRSSLSRALAIGAFQVDDFVGAGRVLSGFPGLAFVDAQGTSWVPDGPLAAALLATPLDRPLYVTGRVDTTRGATQVGQFLIVTSWRTTTTLSWTFEQPLLGTDAFTVEDLEGSGAYHTRSSHLRGPLLADTSGAGRQLGSTLLSDLRARVSAATLRAQPRIFQPAQLNPDHPTTTLELEDAQGAVTITIWAGAALPAPLSDLVAALAALPGAVPTFRTIELGQTSLIQRAGAEAARDQAAWAGLWGRHVGGRPLPPQVDFAREVAVGVFDGLRLTGGFAVEVAQVLRIGPHLHLQVVHTAPGGIVAGGMTAPCHFVAIDRKGAGGELYVGGQRLP